MSVKTNEDLEADYVIVGGGTSSLVLAARLPEDDRSEADWQLITTPQVNRAGQPCNQGAPGKLLGGSSGINGQASIAPSKARIDAWSKLGATDWTWKKLSPCYKKSYTLHWVDQNVNGDSGLINVSFPAVLQDPLSKAWVDTFEGIGYSLTADPFSGNSIGGYSELAAVDYETKTRSYAVTGYGLPDMQRPEVRILTKAMVRKILFDASDAGVTAKGVEAIVQGGLSTIKAKNEAIIDQFNVPVVVENPYVGENLQDHLMSGISFDVKKGVITGNPLMRQEQEAVQNTMQIYTEHKAGPMTIGGIQSSAFMPIIEYHGPNQQEAKQAYLNKFIPQPEGRDQVIRDIYADDNEPTCSMFMFLAQANLHQTGKSFVGQELLPGNFLSLGLELSLPFSRGSAHIASADPNVPPTIDSQYFSNPLDLGIMARNLLDVERIHKADPLAKFLVHSGQRNHLDAFLTDLELAKKYLRDTATAAYHSCGTVAMLPREKGGVVDEKLRVYGTTNLREWDASVFPWAADTIKSDA
ncbi:glucose-methanol-choline oxidoreductase [Aspergillus novoparasiticus]|uniref:glucose oxidase n=1 Tax=Aspergillus novoparasiticus TaxID=986946 RepID=A0A5N6F9V0_9EURO|nr:glucose-methanol-choline oxidoreductase [Aspergillus novoparasiticus]